MELHVCLDNIESWSSLAMKILELDIINQNVKCSLLEVSILNVTLDCI